MPTFEYQLTPPASGVNYCDKGKILDDIRRFFRDVLSHYMVKNFGWCSISSSNINGVLSVASTCTEKDCDEVILSCCSDIYLFGNLDECINYFFVSIKALTSLNEKFQLFSTIPTIDLHDGGVDDDEERECDRKRYAIDLIGDEFHEFHTYEHDGTVYLHASIDADRRDDIVKRCVCSASLDVKKIHGGEIIFWPNWERSNEKANTIAVKERAAALFGSKKIEDPFTHNRSNLFGRTLSTEPPATFKIEPSRFIHRARMMSPKEPQATASSFSQWVYSIYGNAYGDNEDRLTGKEMEKAILEHRSKATASVNNNFLCSIRSDWELIHNGLHLQRNEPVNYFEIKSLNVNDEPLRASPDLIYRNKLTSDILIVEIKYSRLQITTNLWPNVWAQLWCYSQLDIAINARNLTVVGEVWGERWTPARGQGRGRVEGRPLLCLRASVRRDPRAPAYDKFFRTLFDVYRGEC